MQCQYNLVNSEESTFRACLSLNQRISALNLRIIGRTSPFFLGGCAIIEVVRKRLNNVADNKSHFRMIYDREKDESRTFALHPITGFISATEANFSQKERGLLSKNGQKSPLVAQGGVEPPTSGL